MKKIIIIVTLLILAISVVSAAEQLVFVLTLDYDNGVITQEKLFVTKGVFFETPQKNGIYKLEIVSFDDQILYTEHFDFPLEIFFAPLPEWFDEFGNQIYFPNETRKILETATKELILPYFENAKQIVIYGSDDTKFLEIDVAVFAKTCGNNKCDDHESYTDCQKDCPSGEFDGFCDKVAEGKCDPDCLTGDVDCETQQKSIVVPIWVSAIIVLVMIIAIIIWKVKRKPPKQMQQQ